MQGSHPDGTAVSAMDYLLDGQQTVPQGRGLFLEETWRLHSQIAAFTSERFYERRLRSRLGLERQAVVSTGDLTGAGLIYVGVDHTGNQNSSPEKAEIVSALVSELLATRATWMIAMVTNALSRSTTFS